MLSGLASGQELPVPCMTKEASVRDLGTTGSRHTCRELDDALVELPVCYGLPLVAAGVAEAEHGAVCIDFAEALKHLDDRGAVLHEPVHCFVVVCMLLHGTRMHERLALRSEQATSHTAHQQTQTLCRHVASRKLDHVASQLGLNWLHPAKEDTLQWQMLWDEQMLTAICAPCRIGG